MTTDEAQLTANKLGLQCGAPGRCHVRGSRITSLQGSKSAMVVGMHGGNIVATADDGEGLVLAYYEIGVPKTATAV